MLSKNTLAFEMDGAVLNDQLGELQTTETNDKILNSCEYTLATLARIKSKKHIRFMKVS